MPIYEYRCEDCRRKVTVLTLRVGETVDATCEHCGSPRLHRLMSRFAMVRSEDARLDALADDASLGGVDENDPRSVTRWMRKMGQELGEDAGGDVEAMIDDMESSDDAGDADDGAGGDE